MKTVEMRLYETGIAAYDSVSDCYEEGSYFKIRQLNVTTLIPTDRIMKIEIKEGERNYG